VRVVSFRTGDPELLREINRSLILSYLRHHEEVSRAEIARKLNLSRATVSNVINDLIVNKIVTETGSGDSALETGGRPPVILTINKLDKFVIGVDLGTTNTVAAIANLKGEIIEKIRIPTDRNHSVENIVEQVSNLVTQIVAKANIKSEMVIGLGIAVAGTVERATGFIKFSPNFNWRKIHIGQALFDKTGYPAVVDNCTRVMILGEKWFGQGKGFRNLFYVNVGFGIGSAFILDGKIYNGHSEFGHLVITDEKIRCGCGNFGCLEAVASGNAIERKINEQLSADGNVWITAQMVAEKAVSGDMDAQAIFNEVGNYLGRAISYVANLFCPDKIIIGGGIASSGNLLLNPIIDSFNTHTMETVKQNTEVNLSSLGIDAGVYGAIALVLNEFIFSGTHEILGKASNK
jgi:glucokinase-like ROK family protein